MMKSRKLYIVVLSIIMAICTCGLIACGEKEPLTLSESAIEIEAYDELLVSVTSTVEGKITWESSDTSKIQVKDGLIIALGKTGTVEVTAKADGREGKCTVYIINTSGDPELLPSKQYGAVNGLTAIDLEVSYNYKEFKGYTVKDIDVLDKTIADQENGKLKGIKKGETTADITVEWKGVTLTATDVPIEILSEKSISTDKDNYVVYSVNSNSKVKENNVPIIAEIMYRGEPVTSNIEYEVVEGAEFVQMQDNKIVAKKVKKIEQATIRISNEESNVSKDVTVTVYPNYIQKANTDLALLNGSKSIYEPAGKTVGGRTSANRFYATEDCAGVGDWIKFGNQLIISDAKTQSGGVSQYSYLVYELGIRMMSIDVYYTGQTNNKGETEYRGIVANMLYGPNSKNEIYYVEHQKNIDERLIVDNGVITNTLKPNKWQTVYFDLSKIPDGTKTDAFLNCSRVGDEMFVDNLRYWYDDASICDLPSTLDLEKRTLTVDETNSAKIVANDNEFMVFSPSFTDLAKADGEDFYTYKMREFEYSATEKIVQPDYALRRIFPVTVFNGEAVNKQFKYLTVDYRSVSGEALVYAYDIIKRTDVKFNLSSELSEDSLVMAYKDGKRIYTIPQNEWVTLVIKLDVNVSKSDTLYFSTEKDGTEFNLKNVNYYKDDSCIYEYGYNNNLSLTSYDLDVSFVGREYDINDLLHVTYKGKTIKNYTISNIQIADSEIVTKTNNILAPQKVGETTVDFTVTYTENNHTESIDVTIKVIVKPLNYLTVTQNKLLVYAGDRQDLDHRKQATIDVSALVVDGELGDESKIKAELVSGAGLITLDGFTITGIKEGEAVVKVYYEKSPTETIETLIDVVVYKSSYADEFVVYETNLLQYNTSQYYTQSTEVVGGREGVYNYNLPAKDMWNAHLVVGEMNNWATSQNTMSEKGVKYVAFDFYRKANSGLRIGFSNGVTRRANNLKEADVATFIISASGVMSANNDVNKDYVTILDERGAVVDFTDKVASDKWYTMIVEWVPYPELSWWGVMLYGTAMDVYLDNLRIFVDDTVSNQLKLVAPSEISTGEPSTTISAKAYRAGGERTSAQITYESLDQTVATVSSTGNVTFLKKGVVTVMVRATEDGETVTSKVKVSYVDPKFQSEFEMRDSAHASYLTQSTTAIGGRENVYNYNLPSADVWNAYLVIKDFSNWKMGQQDVQNNGIKYVAFDFYRTANSEFRISFSDGKRLKADNATPEIAWFAISSDGKMTFSDASVGETIITIVDDNGDVVDFGDTIASEKWYTIVVKWVPYPNLAYWGIIVNGKPMNVYLDNVYCYRNDSWKVDYIANTNKNYIQRSGDELIVAKDGGGAVIEKTTFAGRDNVTHIVNNSQQTGYTKATTYALKTTDNHTYDNRRTAYNRMLALGVKYVTIDVCRNTSAPLSLYAYGANSGYRSMFVNNSTGVITYHNDCISLYDASGNKVTVMEPNVWYTAVIEWQAVPSQWTAVALEANWINVAVDNVRYYFNDSYIADYGIK